MLNEELGVAVILSSPGSQVQDCVEGQPLMVDCRSESDGNLPRNMSTSNGTHNAPTKAAIKIKCDVTDEGTPVGDTIDREMVHAADHCGGRSSSFSSNHSDVRINAPDNSQRTAAMVGVFVLAVISVWTCPSELNPPGEPTIQQVWYYGWITAVSTGLGVLPLVFVPNLDKFWIGVSNGKLLLRCHVCFV